MKKVLLITSCLALLSQACAKNSGTTSVPTPNENRNKPTESVDNAKATKVIDFNGNQVTGITVASNGRMFANFPRWRENVPYSVVEIKPNGQVIPYPDKNWNDWHGQAELNKFTCVQSVVAFGNSLYVLDPSNPEMMGVVGKPTLYQFDLGTNRLVKKWEFDATVAPSMSYLNDLRIDPASNSIYITESGLGAIIVLNTQTGVARRLLDKSPSTKSEIHVLVVNGKPVVKPSGSPQRFNADGVALFGDYLYYHAVTGYHLYRISTKALLNTGLTESALKAEVEDLGLTPAPDGMIFDKRGNLYMADLERNSIVRRTPQGEIQTVLHDPNLHWADTFTIDPNNNLVFTDSHLEEAPPKFPADGITFSVYKLALPK